MKTTIHTTIAASALLALFAASTLPAGAAEAPAEAVSADDLAQLIEIARGIFTAENAEAGIAAVKAAFANVTDADEVSKLAAAAAAAAVAGEKPEKDDLLAAISEGISDPALADRAAAVVAAVTGASSEEIADGDALKALYKKVYLALRPDAYKLKEFMSESPVVAAGEGEGTKEGATEGEGTAATEGEGTAATEGEGTTPGTEGEGTTPGTTPGTEGEGPTPGTTPGTEGEGPTPGTTPGTEGEGPTPGTTPGEEPADVHDIPAENIIEDVTDIDKTEHEFQPPPTTPSGARPSDGKITPPTNPSTGTSGNRPQREHPKPTQPSPTPWRRQ